MSKLFTAAMATAFAGASTLAVLAASAQSPAMSHAGLFASAPALALADDDDRGNNQGENEGKHGNKNCTNPAGNTRGWCKHGDNEDNRGGKHHRNRGGSYISGTVLGVSGNVVSFRLDNGQVVSILDNNGSQLNVGQHYNLRGSYQNGQFVLGGSGNYNNGGNGGYRQNAHVGGIIVGLGNGTVTIGSIPPVTIDVTQAVNRGATNGPLTVGRTITAYGYYGNNGVFFATSIQ